MSECRTSFHTHSVASSLVPSTARRVNRVTETMDFLKGAADGQVDKVIDKAGESSICFS